MLTQQALRPAEFSSSVIVAPRSSTLYLERFSFSPAGYGAPIGHIQGDARHLLLHGVDRQNPALLKPNSTRSLVSDSTSTAGNNTLVSNVYALSQIQEEEDNNITYLEERAAACYSVVRSPDLTEGITPVSDCSRSISTGSIHRKHNVWLDVNQSALQSFTLSSDSIAPSMIASVSAPGTPPELTESHSSKSSYGSRISSPEDFAGTNMNFEEINLEDDHHTNGTRQISARSSSKENVTQQPSITKRPALATLQTHENRHLRAVENGVKSAATPVSKRYFSSPTVPASSPRNPARTRSESPALHKVPSASRLGQFAHTPASSLAIPGRRGSWQPNRKTIYEIEAEYHDSDDELPEDASLFNVPISPFPSHPRSAPRSARSSAPGSPEREGERELNAINPAPIPLGHARTRRETPSKRRNGPKPPSRQKLPARVSSAGLTQSKSASTSPRMERFTRTKSWNLVMADLDHEARIIAEKLDFHQEVASKSANSSTNSFRSSAPGAIPLPPIQKGTLDFMPMSKEKEAVLSRTRPSWLPPKDPREEKKHLQEYQQMMKASIEAEKRREERIKNMQSAKEDTRGSLRRIWTYYADPSTDLNSIDRRVNDLCWRGIPSNLRGSVWQRTVGNPLGLTSDTFELATKRVQEIESRPEEELTEHEKKMRRWFADIERDAETAFPDTSIFLKHGPHHKDLIDLCEAYTSYRAETGYVYGVQLIAALILLQVPKPAEAFIHLANCLNRTMPEAFQTGDIEATARAYAKVKSTLDIKFPRLHSYLFSEEEQGGLGFTGEELFETMFRTLFANGLDLDRLCRVWDIWTFESDRYLVRTAVALLGAMQQQIFDIQGDIHLRRRNIQEMLGWGPFNRTENGYWKFDTAGDGDSFVEEIRAAGRLDAAGR